MCRLSSRIGQICDRHICDNHCCITDPQRVNACVIRRKGVTTGDGDSHNAQSNRIARRCCRDSPISLVKVVGLGRLSAGRSLPVDHIRQHVTGIHIRGPQRTCQISKARNEGSVSKVCSQIAKDRCVICSNHINGQHSSVADGAIVDFDRKRLGRRCPCGQCVHSGIIHHIGVAAVRIDGQRAICPSQGGGTQADRYAINGVFKRGVCVCVYANQRAGHICDRIRRSCICDSRSRADILDDRRIVSAGDAHNNVLRRLTRISGIVGGCHRIGQHQFITYIKEIKRF